MYVSCRQRMSFLYSTLFLFALQAAGVTSLKCRRSTATCLRALYRVDASGLLRAARMRSARQSLAPMKTPFQEGPTSTQKCSALVSF